MRCGAKCFLVKIEADEGEQISCVIARTPAEARKNFRAKYGAASPILSVCEKKRKNGI